jgi:hypothetical protein
VRSKTKKDLHLNDLSVLHPKKLGIAKRRATLRLARIPNERLIALHEQLLDAEGFDLFVEGPASLEVGAPIDPVVLWARKSERIGDYRLEGGAVLRFVRCIARRTISSTVGRSFIDTSSTQDGFRSDRRRISGRVTPR